MILKLDLEELVVICASEMYGTECELLIVSERLHIIIINTSSILVFNSIGLHMKIGTKTKDS